ncbi:type I-E CRISPR-associated protein Cse2/CasB [Levilactobacillus spicheri]|uniref:Type I-E CRISPR-associated protein Cse2/CasB n=2 Tax=Levilactobacillus spicheri TaxID=216463 RepID=A0ABQ0WP80_9LACO|nr:type I-E CRISPR-associated protein Cse2/CasB [Levilactobacillus spicheri]GEO66872.1 type I-E CRISPR-associated protein Cse2/CasB [Levilactobacillus spicheri]
MNQEIRQVTAHALRALYQDGHPNTAALASARSTTSFTSPRAQAVWPVMLASLTPQMLSHQGQPTAAETAVYAAVRLFAIHQQGQSVCAYAPAIHQQDDATKGTELFKALAEFRNADNQQALDRRVRSVLSTGNVASILNELSHLVKILKASKRAPQVDYAQLAQDVYGLQQNYQWANQIRLRWGEQYFWQESSNTQTEGKTHA